MRALPLSLTLLSVAAAADAPATVETLLEAKLTEKIQAIDRRLNGVLGVHIVDIGTGHTISWHADSVFPQASSIKIPIMMEVFRQAGEGKFRLSDSVTLQPAETVAGSGHLHLMLRLHPVTLTIEDLITAMIATSDNTATNRLIALAGMDRVNASLDRLGFRQTRLRRKMLDAEAAARNDENVSTPAEMARLVELIYRGKAVDVESSRRMIEIMKLVNAGFRAAVPANVPVASKPGELTGVRCETGVIFIPNRPVILSVGSTFLEGTANPVPETARLVYEHFATLAKSNRYGNGGVR